MKRACSLIPLLPLIALAALIGLGCQTTEHAQVKENVAMAAPVVERPEFIFHKVMPGETMATIARWYSGKDSNWREIAEHNPDLSPNKLRKDEIVKVPVSLATVHEEQPSFSTAPKKAKKTNRGKAPASGSAAVGPEQPDDSAPPQEVFGPR